MERALILTTPGAESLAADVPVIHAASLRHGDAREIGDALDAAGFFAPAAAGLILEKRRSEALERAQG